MVDDGDQPVAASVHLENDLFRDLSSMMTKRWRNGQQVQARCPDHLAEVGRRHLLVEVADGDLPPLRSTITIVLNNILVLR